MLLAQTLEYAKGWSTGESMLTVAISSLAAALVYLWQYIQSLMNKRDEERKERDREVRESISKLEAKYEISDKRHEECEKDRTLLRLELDRRNHEQAQFLSCANPECPVRFKLNQH